MPIINGTRFGSIEYTEADTLTLLGGLIGLPEFSRFIVVCPNPKSAFRWLQSLDNPAAAFLVVDPNRYVDGYAPEISDTDAATLELTHTTATLLFTTASIPHGKPDELSLNLAGPIVINAETRRGRQFAIESESCPLRYRVFTLAEKTKVEAAA